MKPKEALSLLGSSRVIWIDDQFRTDTPEELAKLLSQYLEIARQLPLDDGVTALIDRVAMDDESALVELTENLLGMDAAARVILGGQFHALLATKNGGIPDLNTDQIRCVQKELGIGPGDSWTFDRADGGIRELAEAEGGDGHITFIVDLQDEYGAQGNERGLELLRLLGQLGSKATVFLLTRNASKATEADLEDDLRVKLTMEDAGGVRVPVCVIAKERLEGKEAVIVEGLRVALKRAGLRRGIHEVLLRANEELQAAFDDARKRLLRIPPEQLDRYVVDRAYKEGVSELHVVERALSASMSDRFKRLFANDTIAVNGAGRFRKLRNIRLEAPTSISTELQDFRRIEIWEDAELVNSSHSPLACGDVFAASVPDAAGELVERRFILLVQPCDVMLRPEGKRESDVGVLAQIQPRDYKDSNSPSLKKPLLPFVLDGVEWICEFRKSATANLCVLDASTWLRDGTVRYQHGDIETLPTELLPGQVKNAKRISGQFEEALVQCAELETPASWRLAPDCLLSLSRDKMFRALSIPAFTAFSLIPKNGDQKRVTSGRFEWPLRRVGRIRMPYAAALLSNYLAVQGRAAFDLDYLQADDLPSSPSKIPLPGSPCELACMG
jgi:hypothetical protein